MDRPIVFTPRAFQSSKKWLRKGGLGWGQERGRLALPRLNFTEAYFRLEFPLLGCPKALLLLRRCLSAGESEPSLWRGRQDAQEKGSWVGRTR